MQNINRLVRRSTFSRTFFSCAIISCSTLYAPITQASFDHEYYPVDCGDWSYELRKEEEALLNFEERVVKPLRREFNEIDQALKYKIARPKKLRDDANTRERQILGIEREIRTIKLKIETEEKRAVDYDKLAADAEKQGNLALKAKYERAAREIRNDNRKREGTIGAYEGRVKELEGAVESYRAEADEIEKSEPTVQKLERDYDRLRARLDDVNGLKREQEQKVLFAQKSNDLCRDFNNLLTDYRVLKASCDH